MAARRAQAIAAPGRRDREATQLHRGLSPSGRDRDAPATATRPSPRLKAGLQAVPDDATGLASLIELLAEPREDGRKPTPAELAEAEALARVGRPARREGEPGPGPGRWIPQGRPARAGPALGRESRRQARRTTRSPQLRRPAPLDRRGPATPSRPALLPTRRRRSTTWSSRAMRPRSRRSTTKPGSSTRYLGDSRRRLALALEPAERADPATLPGEFFDTLGSIQEATGRRRDAEDSFSKGLRKTPDHPVLNFHMGKLIASDPKRSGRAAGYLEKRRPAETGEPRCLPTSTP